MTVSAVNWSKNTSDLAKIIWDQQWQQIWFPEEVAVSKDLRQWHGFEHKDTYKKLFGGLTLLDTVQTNIGMNQLSQYLDDDQDRALLSVFGAFEAIHAKSYSYIFTTLCTTEEIDEVFEWVDKNEYLQYKAKRIKEIYEAIDPTDAVSKWKALFASVMLESFLFYSGFFYPLYLGGQGQLRNSAEIISLILRDESIHGVTVGYLGQKIFDTFSEELKAELKDWAYDLLLDLYDNEMKYTEELYGPTGLTRKVKAYIRYNANKALMNIGLDTIFPDEEIDAIVMNGIANEGSTYDFFSQKGATYTTATVLPITDKFFELAEMTEEDDI